MPGSTPPRRRSGAIAAALSFLFPGLGQAYLRRSGDAVKFALPIVTAIVVLAVLVVSAGGVLGLAARAFDPTISFPAAIVVLVLGGWWIASIVHAWRSGSHAATASFVVMLALVFTVGVVDAWGAVSLWRIGNVGIEISTGDPLDESNRPTPTPIPTPTPVPTATPPGQTPGPTASPTQPPPDIDYPEDVEPSDEPEPSLLPGPTPGYDITLIDNENDGYLNVLLGGIDWWEGRIGARTDTMLVVSVNSETGEVLMFSFPRDLQGFPIYNGGTYDGRLNTFAGVSKLYPDKFPEPGMPALANQIGFLLGIPIDYYASVNMEGFQEVVDIVGGITIYNDREIADDHLQFYLPVGEHRLGPADALRYVRSRKGQAGGDFARAKRQQIVLAALRREMLKPANLPRVADIAEALADVVKTNYPPSQIDQLLELAKRVEEEPSRTWVFKSPEWAQLLKPSETGRRRSILTPRIDRIAELSRELFGEKSLYN